MNWKYRLSELLFRKTTDLTSNWSNFNTVELLHLPVLRTCRLLAPLFFKQSLEFFKKLRTQQLTDIDFLQRYQIFCEKSICQNSTCFSVNSSIRLNLICATGGFCDSKNVSFLFVLPSFLLCLLFYLMCSFCFLGSFTSCFFCIKVNAKPITCRQIRLCDFVCCTSSNAGLWLEHAVWTAWLWPSYWGFSINFHACSKYYTGKSRPSQTRNVGRHANKRGFGCHCFPSQDYAQGSD